VTPIAPFRITVCGIDELPDHNAAGVSHVLSILDPGWPVPDAFGEFGEHARLELRFHDIIEETPGMIAPGEGHVGQLLGFGRDLAAEPPKGAHLLVHCHAGVSRSTASMILILAQALPEMQAADIAQHVLRIRPQAWPNLRIIELGDAMTGRDGEIVAAARTLYRKQLDRRPEIAADFTRNGRAREVEAAERAGA